MPLDINRALAALDSGKTYYAKLPSGRVIHIRCKRFAGARGYSIDGDRFRMYAAGEFREWLSSLESVSLDEVLRWFGTLTPDLAAP